MWWRNIATQITKEASTNSLINTCLQFARQNDMWLRSTDPNTGSKCLIQIPFSSQLAEPINQIQEKEEGMGEEIMLHWN